MGIFSHGRRVSYLFHGDDFGHHVQGDLYYCTTAVLVGASAKPSWVMLPTLW